MFRLKAVFIFLILFILIPFSSNADFHKIKIAVLDFQLQGSGYQTSDMGKIVAEWLTTALVKEGRFEVVERRLLAKILKEQDLHMTGLVDHTSTAKVGKLLGVKVIISGSVMKYQNVLEANARIIDVESASIIAAESARSDTAIRLEDLVVKMAELIIKDFPLEGYIVNRNGVNVLIDLGKQAGVKTGMRFIVYREGNVIKHPKTGEVLDVEMIETGKVEIKSVRNNTADAKIINEKEGGGIEYGQLVKCILKPVKPIGRYSAKNTLSSLYKHDGPHDEAAYLFKEKKYDDVIKLLTKFSISPDDYRLNVLLAMARMEKCAILKKKGDKSYHKLIFTPYRTGLKLYKKNATRPEPFYIIGKCLFINNRPRKAAGFMNKAIYYSPDNAHYDMVLGDIYLEMNLYSKAEKSYKKALELGQGDNGLKGIIEKRLSKLNQKRK